MTAPVWTAAPPRRRAAITDHHRESELTPGIGAGWVLTSDRGVGTPVGLTGLVSKVSGDWCPKHALIMKTIFSKLCCLELVRPTPQLER